MKNEKNHSCFHNFHIYADDSLLLKTKRDGGRNLPSSIAVYLWIFSTSFQMSYCHIWKRDKSEWVTSSSCTTTECLHGGRVDRMQDALLLDIVSKISDITCMRRRVWLNRYMFVTFSYAVPRWMHFSQFSQADAHQYVGTFACVSGYYRVFAVTWNILNKPKKLFSLPPFTEGRDWLDIYYPCRCQIKDLEFVVMLESIITSKAINCVLKVLKNNIMLCHLPRLTAEAQGGAREQRSLCALA